MSRTSGAAERTVSSPIRSSLAQSTARSTRSAASSGGSRTRSSSGMNAYSCGSGVWPGRYMTASLPSCRRARLRASSEPRASPSGFSCVTTRKRSCRWRASAIAFRSVVCVIVVRRELVDQAGHAHAALDRRIVLEGQLRSSFHSELAREPRLEDTVRGLEPHQAGAPFPARAEHADVDRRVPQIRRRLDRSHSDEPDPRVLELGKRFGEHLPHRLVHPAHALAHCNTLLTARPRGRAAAAPPCRPRSRTPPAATPPPSLLPPRPAHGSRRAARLLRPAPRACAGRRRRLRGRSAARLSPAPRPAPWP